MLQQHALEKLSPSAIAFASTPHQGVLLGQNTCPQSSLSIECTVLWKPSRLIIRQTPLTLSRLARAYPDRLPQCPGALSGGTFVKSQAQQTESCGEPSLTSSSSSGHWTMPCTKSHTCAMTCAAFCSFAPKATSCPCPPRLKPPHRETPLASRTDLSERHLALAKRQKAGSRGPQRAPSPKRIGAVPSKACAILNCQLKHPAKDRSKFT